MRKYVLTIYLLIFIFPIQCFELFAKEVPYEKGNKQDDNINKLEMDTSNYLSKRSRSLKTFNISPETFLSSFNNQAILHKLPQRIFFIQLKILTQKILLFFTRNMTMEENIK